MRKKAVHHKLNKWTLFFVVWGSYTFQKLSFLPPEFFRRCKMFLQRNFFISQFLPVFFVWNVSPHKKECIPTFKSLGKCWTRAVMGIFRWKIEVKSSKSFCRGNFLFVPFNPLFYVWTMRQCFKNIPAKVSKPSDVSGRIFFQKSYGRRRSKEDFLPRFMWWVQLLNFAALLPWSTVPAIAACACISSESALRELSQLSSSKFLDFSLCFLSFELLCLTMSSPSDFSFKAKEQLFEQTFYHLIFPVRGKSIVDLLWKSWSHVSTSEIEFTSCRSRRGKQSCTQWSCLVSSQGVIAWRGWSNRKGGIRSVVSVLFSFVSVDSCSSTGERKTGSATWDWQEHLAFVCFVSLSLSSLSLSPLSLSPSLSLEHALPFFLLLLLPFFRVRHRRDRWATRGLLLSSSGATSEADLQATLVGCHEYVSVALTNKNGVRQEKETETS